MSETADRAPRSCQPAPRPTDEGAAVQAWDDLYDRYLSGHAGHEDPAALDLVLRRDLLPYVPSPHSRCLDLGCGQGGLVEFLRQHGVRRAVGVDRSAEQVEQAHRLGRTYVEQGDASDCLARTERQWDVVTAFDFFEHLPKVAVLPMMRAVHGALAPRGQLIMRVPNAAGPLSGAIQYGDFTHESVFTARSVQQLANAAGFTSATFRESPPILHGAKSAVRRAVWSGYAGITRLAMAAETGRVRGHIVTSNFMAYLRA